MDFSVYLCKSPSAILHETGFPETMMQLTHHWTEGWCLAPVHCRYLSATLMSFAMSTYRALMGVF